MKLNNESLKNKEQWSDMGINLPAFDREAMIKATYENPVWVHFGAGNIFRAFPAKAQQDLLEQGLTDKGIIAAFPIEPEVIENLWKPCDNLSLLVTLKSDGEMEKTVVGSISEALYADKNGDWDRMKTIFKSKSLQMVSFTITEKGYADTSGNGVMAKLTELLHERFLENKAPIALVSMDNCAENGKILHNAVRNFAKNYSEDFVNYIDDENTVGFPWSMIDKITPRPDDGVKESLLKLGFEDAQTIITDKGTYASAFVNAEECQYLVIEDLFPNNRPCLEKAGIIFADRETVNKTEKMKVGTCLNPLHTALAVFGCLLSYTSISAEMKDVDLVNLIKTLGYKEGMPVVVNPKIINPEEFLKEVLEKRFPNPFLPDTPQRIATDTSQKLPVRYGETLKLYIENKLDIDCLEAIPMVFAGWCRYLCGVNDSGERFTLSPDPMHSEFSPLFGGIELGKAINVHEILSGILSREDIFGIDLYKTSLGGKVEYYFEKMIKNTGAVREVLQSLPTIA